MTDELGNNFGPQRQREVFLKAYADMPENIPTDFNRLRDRAKSEMDEGPFGYVAGNAGKEMTNRGNKRAFDEWEIQPRVLRGPDERNLTTDVIGQSISAPLMLAPVGVQSIIHPEGAKASAEAATNLGIPFVHSTVSSFTIEDIADCTGRVAPWFQLYCSRVDSLNKSLINRAEEAGYQAIVITLDTTIMGWRPRDLDNGYMPFLDGEGLANYTSDPVFRDRISTEPELSMEDAIEEFIEIFSDPGLDWSEIEGLAESTELPVFVKGIMHREDAQTAVERGIDGVIVSNHGGRQIDGERAALDVLEPTIEAVPEEYPVLFDSGIRGGSDVFKASALGADAVLLGRPYLYGLGIEGADGVEAVIKNVAAELDITMGLCGIESVESITRDYLVAS